MTQPAKILIQTITRRLRAPSTSNLLAATTPISIGNTRSSSFRSSRELRPIEEYPEVEVVKNPPEWKFVDRVLPKATIPKPEKRAEYPSGWKWPEAAEKDPKELKYFVSRTKNHMMPVYVEAKFRGQRRITVVKRIQGDIWALEKDLRVVVEKARGKLCASRVNEMSQQIHFHGDYEDVIREFLRSKGF